MVGKGLRSDALDLKGGAPLWSHVHYQLEDVRSSKVPSSIHPDFGVINVGQVNVSCDQGISWACLWACQYWCEGVNDGSPTAACFHNLYPMIHQSDTRIHKNVKQPNQLRNG